MTDVAKQCSVLLINPVDAPWTHRPMLEALGFRVAERRDWPEDEHAVLDHEIVILRVRNISGAPMLATRLRAKPRFGRRVLIALVAPATSPQDCLAARSSGFDEVLTDCCDARHLTARILRRLRTRPEYRCLLPPGERRHRAA